MGRSFTLWMSWLLSILLAVGMTWFGLARAAAPAVAAPPIAVLEVQGAISPASADFIIGAIDTAEASGTQLLIIELDTPGGLDASMRAIIRRMLSAQLPIAVYVGPGGARAASAGTFILYASHIAAMAPASNLGAASPVSIGGGMPGRDSRPDPSVKQENSRQRSREDTLASKAVNDAAAYIRSLAELRGRNPKFAELAVREASSMSAGQALKEGVIEYIAPSVPALLEQLNGREITLDNGVIVTLATKAAAVQRIAPDWRTRMLSFLANPQLAVILMMLGIYGLFFEMMSPGVALPGVAGLICLLLAFYGLNMLPVNWAGVALLAFGLLLMVAEVFLPSFGALGVGGLLAFVLGGLFMTGPDVPRIYELSVPFLLSIGLASAAIIIGAGTVAIRSRRAKKVSGYEAMLGQQGTVVALENGVAYAEIQGENWRVLCDNPLQVGDHVQVTGSRDLKLRVSRISSGTTSTDTRTAVI